MKFNKELIMQDSTVVHCRTEEQANQLLEWADSIGLKWITGNSYKNYTNYISYHEQTCYYLYEGTYTDLEFYKEKGYKILSFEEAIIKEDKVKPTIPEAVKLMCEGKILVDKDGFEYYYSSQVNSFMCGCCHEESLINGLWKEFNGENEFTIKETEIEFNYPLYFKTNNGAIVEFTGLRKGIVIKASTYLPIDAYSEKWAPHTDTDYWAQVEKPKQTIIERRYRYKKVSKYETRLSFSYMKDDYATHLLEDDWIKIEDDYIDEEIEIEEV